jgi:hypothetical protein
MSLARIAKFAAALLPLTVVAAGLALPAAAGAASPRADPVPAQRPGTRPVPRRHLRVHQSGARPEPDLRPH